MSKASGQSRSVVLGAAIAVLGAAVFLLGLVANLLSVRDWYFEMADGQARTGWVLLAVVVLIAGFLVLWQSRSDAHLRGQEETRHATNLQTVRDEAEAERESETAKAERQAAALKKEHADEIAGLKEKHRLKLEELEKARIGWEVDETELTVRAQAAEGEVETLQRQVAELVEPKRMRADVELVNKTLGDLAVGGRVRDTIINGQHECKYFDRDFLRPLDEFRHEASEALVRLKDRELRDRLAALLDALAKFHDGTSGLIFVRRPHDPGTGDLMLVQPPEGPWAARDPEDPWRAYYDVVRAQQRSLGEVCEALVGVERRLHDLRVDYL
ncbi:hypothetical protein EEW87_004360 [Janibacter melonis]|uniref:Uncharacterized protein n=1 Tax=Janibacter melonis TaxID=262209 RepID=A0A5P8FLM8_9MICO|nr:hypothetical protein [Janibacter melonis]QFQ29732.2 hypothetical protein EEW87_004360 [Janibacter melonis]